MQVIGSVYVNDGEYGDFGWMLKQPDYDDALFIFNDNEPQFRAFLKDQTPGSEGCAVGGGNAAIRPYRCQNPPRAQGIPTGTTHGYPQLTPEVKQVIDESFGVIRTTLKSGRYERVFYSAADAQGDLGVGIFKDLGDDVKSYIVAELRKLAQ